MEEGMSGLEFEEWLVHWHEHPFGEYKPVEKKTQTAAEFRSMFRVVKKEAA